MSEDENISIYFFGGELISSCFFFAIFVQRNISAIDSPFYRRYIRVNRTEIQVRGVVWLASGVPARNDPINGGRCFLCGDSGESGPKVANVELGASAFIVRVVSPGEEIQVLKALPEGFLI